MSNSKCELMITSRHLNRSDTLVLCLWSFGSAIQVIRLTGIDLHLMPSILLSCHGFWQCLYFSISLSSAYSMCIFPWSEKCYFFLFHWKIYLNKFNANQCEMCLFKTKLNEMLIFNGLRIIIRIASLHLYTIPEWIENWRYN